MVRCGTKSREPIPILPIDSYIARPCQKQNTALKTRKFPGENEPVSARGPILRFRVRAARPQNVRGRPREKMADFPREMAIILLELRCPLAQKSPSLKTCIANYPLAWQKNAQSSEKIAPSFGTCGPKTVKTRFAQDTTNYP
jgi:hypothetical protein